MPMPAVSREPRLKSGRIWASSSRASLAPVGDWVPIFGVPLRLCFALLWFCSFPYELRHRWDRSGRPNARHEGSAGHPAPRCGTESSYRAGIGSLRTVRRNKGRGVQRGAGRGGYLHLRQSRRPSPECDGQRAGIKGPSDATEVTAFLCFLLLGTGGQVEFLEFIFSLEGPGPLLGSTALGVAIHVCFSEAFDRASGPPFLRSVLEDADVRA